MATSLPIRLRSVIAVLIAALLLVPLSARGTQAPIADVDEALRAARGVARIVLQSFPGREDAAAAAVRARGGEITRALPIVHGFAARVPVAGIDDLARVGAVRSISLDRRMIVQSGGNGNGTTQSLHARIVRADDVWSAGVTGSGVGVALIDTGVADVPDLTGRIVTVTDDLTGQTAPCVNMTSDPDCTDNYGHGTFMAGLIAGDGAASNGKWKGIAPQANIVSIKVAGRDGAADVSTVLAAIQWAVSFKDRYGIRVMNLSLGTNSTQTYRTDPLNYAVERAWADGIAVIVSASNLGPNAATIAKPGDDPWVITVGATDDHGTVGLGDDVVPDFSSRGPTAADGLPKPDIAAPGAHTVSLRAPGSLIDTSFPGTYFDGWYRRGSGTSMSAAVVSGVAALMVQATPAITPDRLKFALVHTARPAASSDPMDVGAGVADAYAAAFSAPPGAANQGLDRSSGLGTLDLSRGTVTVNADDPLQTVINGTLTLQLLLWNPTLYTTADWTGAKWYDAQWYGAKWYGAKWYGAKWYGAKWYGAKWYEDADPNADYGLPLIGGAFLGAWE